MINALLSWLFPLELIEPYAIALLGRPVRRR